MTAPDFDPAGNAAYPAELEREVTSDDGEPIRLRPIRADDAGRLQDLHSRLSRQTVYQRFFSLMRRLPTDWARYLANVDYRRRLALVLERGPASAPELIGVGRYEPTDDPAAAEVAFVVEDRWQNRGLGTLLFTELLAAAEARGIHRFHAEVLADNRRMLDLIVRLGHVESRNVQAGAVSLVFTRRPPGVSPVAPERR
jgi:RimJ/RimL family protein N-acetyltransferase